MHEEEPRRFHEHVTVQGRDRDPIRPQGLDDWVDFAGDHHEVTGGRGLAAAGALEIDCRRHAHCGRDFLVINRDRTIARYAHLIDAAVHFAVRPKGCGDPRGVEVKWWW